MLVSLREKGVDLNIRILPQCHLSTVSLREKGVDLNDKVAISPTVTMVSLREKGVDLNKTKHKKLNMEYESPFVRREWI